MAEAAKAVDEALAAEVSVRLDTLDPESKAKLSKVLFPDAHKTKLTLLGIEKELRVLPIKWGRMLHEQLKGLAAEIGDAMSGDEQQHDLNDESISGLMGVGKVLCDFYGRQDNWWNETFKVAIENEEVSIPELQDLALTQAEINGGNDFLLGPLRAVIRVQQIYELLERQFRSMSITLQPAKLLESDSPDS